MIETSDRQLVAALIDAGGHFPDEAYPRADSIWEYDPAAGGETAWIAYSEEDLEPYGPDTSRRDLLWIQGELTPSGTRFMQETKPS